MKKLLIVLLIVLSLGMISCTQMVEEEEAPINIPELLVRGENALEDGHDAEAETLFRQVLSNQPNHPKANMAMGCIQLLKGNRKIITLIESVSNQLSSHQRRANPITLLMDLNFRALQTDLTFIIKDLERGKTHLEKAMAFMTAETTITLYPNRFDWNQDGYVDPTTPLNLSVDVYGTGETRLWWVLFYNPGPVSSPRAIFDETKRGDAWFDIETINGLVYENVLPIGYEPVFDENDHIELTQAEVEVLLGFVNMELALLEPALIYDINPKPELMDFIAQASNTIHLYDNPLDFATQTLDTDQNGTITNTEIRTIFPESFLSFYNDSEGGLNAINDWKDAINDFAQIGSRLEGEGFFEFTHADMDSFFEALDAIVNDENFQISLDSAPLIASRIRIPVRRYLKPSVFFNHPNRFEDLKDLLIPDIGYLTYTITFPDPTFGGLVNEEMPVLPSPFASTERSSPTVYKLFQPLLAFLIG